MVLPAAPASHRAVGGSTVTLESVALVSVALDRGLAPGPGPASATLSAVAPRSATPAATAAPPAPVTDARTTAGQAAQVEVVAASKPSGAGVLPFMFVVEPSPAGLPGTGGTRAPPGQLS